MFLIKLLVIDTNSLGLITGDDFSFINLYCKKGKADFNKTNTQEFEKAPDLGNDLLTVNSFCTPQYNLELFSWDFRFSENINSQNNLFSSRLNDRYLESHSPPPRLL